MKEILKNLPWCTIGFIGFVIITIMDALLLGVAMCVKAIRSIVLWLQVSLDPRMDYDDMEGAKNIGSFIVNEAYKTYVDKLYPVKEDEEESE